MPVEKKWIVNLSGKDFPTWPGVLDLATSEGLFEIETDLVQIPHPDNRDVAIVKATVKLEKDGKVRTFSAYGDASAANVNPRIKEAIIRMAETRAKGRALRDAVNVGETMYEELPDTKAEVVDDPADREKKLKRYEDLRAEYVSFGLKDPGPLARGATIPVIEQRVRAIWPEIVEQRRSAAQEAPKAPASPATTTTSAAPAPAIRTVTLEELRAGWGKITARADELGLHYEKLGPNASAQILKARGESLAQTVAQVERDLREWDALLETAGEWGLEVVDIDRKKVDPNILARKVEALRKKVDEAVQAAETGEPEAGEEPVDPFEDEGNAP